MIAKDLAQDFGSGWITIYLLQHKFWKFFELLGKLPYLALFEKCDAAGFHQYEDMEFTIITT